MEVSIMQIRWIRMFEWTLNLLAIALIAYVLGTAVRQHVDARSQKPFASLALGHTFPIDGVDWTKSSHNLVFALSVGCHFCAASAPFYRALLEKQTSGDWRPLAVLPQSVELDAAYMHLEGYSIKEIHQADFNLLGISATPTLLLVNEQGKVMQEWIGELSSADQDDVVNHLGIPKLAIKNQEDPPKENQSYSPVISTTELLAVLKSGGKINLLDIRDKTAYQYGHITGTINLPLDQIATQGWHEILLDKPTILYCHFSPACQFNGIPSLCSNGIEQLREIKVTNVRVIRDPLPLLAESGVGITGKSDKP